MSSFQKELSDIIVLYKNNCKVARWRLLFPALVGVDSPINFESVVHDDYFCSLTLEAVM